MRVLNCTERLLRQRRQCSRTRIESQSRLEDPDYLFSLLSRYQSQFDSHRDYLFGDDPALIQQGVAFFANFLLIAISDVGERSQRFAELVEELQIRDRVIELFMEAEEPPIIEHCAVILDELMFASKWPIDESFGIPLAERIVHYFSYGIQSFNETLLTLIGNLCTEYPGMTKLLLNNDVFGEMYHFFMIEISDVEGFTELMGWTGWRIVSNPFDQPHFDQIATFTRELFMYKMECGYFWALKILQRLYDMDVDMDLPDRLIKIFIFLSASCPGILGELLKTLSKMKNDEFFEAILTNDFLNNLAIQIYRHPTKAAKPVFKFLRFILPVTRPVIGDIIIPIAFSAITHGSFETTHWGLKYLLACCQDNPTFTLDMAAAGGIAVLLKVVEDHQAAKTTDYALDILLAFGRCCQVGGFDLRQMPNYSDMTAILAAADEEIEADSPFRVKLDELLGFYWSEEEAVAC
jgi:hypothetical protein